MKALPPLLIVKFGVRRHTYVETNGTSVSLYRNEHQLAHIVLKSPRFIYMSPVYVFNHGFGVVVALYRLRLQAPDL